MITVDRSSINVHEQLACMQHLSSAARHYITALKLQKGNIYAANGLGAVAGALGQLDAARTILSQLRESAGLASGFVEVPDVRHQHALTN